MTLSRIMPPARRRPNVAGRRGNDESPGTGATHMTSGPVWMALKRLCVPRRGYDKAVLKS